MLFELLGREPPDPRKPPETLVAEFLEGGLPAESTKLYEGFVAEEARLFLPHLGDTRSVAVVRAVLGDEGRMGARGREILL